MTSRPTIAAAVAVAAGAISLSMGAGAATVTYIITDGTQAINEHSCTRIVNQFTGRDCTYGNTQTSPQPAWIGPTRQGGYYPIGSAADTPLGTPPTYNPNDADPTTTNVFEPDTIKVNPKVVGKVDIDDNGTPGDGADDKVLLTFSIQGNTPTAGIVRSFTTGQTTLAVERWRSMDHTMAAPYTVNQAVPNAFGGFDYIIGSRGTPPDLCRATSSTTFDPTDCFPTNNFDKPTVPPPPTWWGPRPNPGSVGIERGTGLTDKPGPAYDTVGAPVPNIGIQTIGQFAGRVIGVDNENYSCDTNNASSDDCVNSVLVWGALEDPGFDNMVGIIQTGTDGIVSAKLYWTQEYFIGAFGADATKGDNSWQASQITFTGIPQGTAPNALDDAFSVVQGTTTNTLNVLANDLNFDPVPPTTVTIASAPAQGQATVNANGTINYNAAGGTPATPGTVTFQYEACLGELCDTATVTLTVQADQNPGGGAVALALNTQGRSGTAAAGSVTLANLGNTPSTVTLTSTGTVGKGTCTVAGATITYTPTSTFVDGGATDSCGYSITDLDGDNATGTVNVTITDVAPVLNDPAPREVDAGDSATSDATFTAGNGVVADHTLEVTTQAQGGSCAVSVVGSNVRVTYTANADGSGNDSCTVTLTDADGDSDTGVFAFEVISTGVTLPGGGSAIDPWSLLLLGGLPILARRRRG